MGGGRPGEDMTGRLPSRNKKLVRSRRLNREDTSEDDSDDAAGGDLDQPSRPAACSGRPPAMPEAGAPAPAPHNKWKRASVRAVQLQEHKMDFMLWDQLAGGGEIDGVDIVYNTIHHYVESTIITILQLMHTLFYFIFSYVL